MNKDLAKLIDHTNLDPRATKDDIKKLIDDAIKNEFAAICIDPSWVSFATQTLSNKKSKVRVATVPNFKLGGGLDQLCGITDTVFVMADEVDYILNVYDLGDLEDLTKTTKELKIVRDKTKGKLKIIIESYYIRIMQEKLLKIELKDAIKNICNVINKSGADYIKTDSGLFGRPDFESLKLDVELIKKYTKVAIKAAGGISTKNQAQILKDLGVKRIGSSKGIAIINS